MFIVKYANYIQKTNCIVYMFACFYSINDDENNSVNIFEEIFFLFIKNTRHRCDNRY